MNDKIIGNNKDFLNALDKAKCLAKLDHIKTITLVGESGTGKELFAKYIVENSSRNTKPFDTLNCAFMPEGILYSELFGHIKGAFTGASEYRHGLIKKVDGGTLFIDEFGKSSKPFQAGFLRFVESGDFKQAGTDKSETADVRIILGVNRDIKEWRASGDVFPDFINRIEAFTITIPPLRERRDDIPELVDFFIKKHSLSFHMNVTGVSDTILNHFLSYNWPGNVRELENLIEVMVALSNGDSIVTEIPDYIKDRLTNPPGIEPISNLENILKPTLQTWDEKDGNILNNLIEPILAKLYIDDFKLPKNNASKIIGIDGSKGKKSTLNERYKKYNSIKKNNTPN